MHACRPRNKKMNYNQLIIYQWPRPLALVVKTPGMQHSKLLFYISIHHTSRESSMREISQRVNAWNNMSTISIYHISSIYLICRESSVRDISHRVNAWNKMSTFAESSERVKVWTVWTCVNVCEREPCERVNGCERVNVWACQRVSVPARERVSMWAWEHVSI